MAGTKPLRIGSFAPGVDNRLERSQLESVNAMRQRLQALSRGENIDIDDKGGIRRRSGFVPQTDEGAAHSLWGDGGADGYAVLDGDLVRLVPQGWELAVSLVREGIGAHPVSFDRLADARVVWTDGLRLGAIRAGEDGLLCAPPLTLEPDIHLALGMLAAGRYLVAVTRVEDGLEGPATTPVQVDAPAGSSLVVSGLPDTRVRVYVSACNGADPLLQFDGIASEVLLPAVSEDGIRCQTLRLACLPPGRIVREFRGRVLVAVGRYLCFSEPYAPGLYAPGQNFIPFPADITVVRPVEGGVFIVADQTYWTPSLTEGPMRAVLPYGAVPGSDSVRPDKKQAAWLSDRGLILADADGSLRNVQEDRLSLAGGVAGATVLREKNGATHVLTLRTGAAPDLNPADGYLAAQSPD
jgi:hypothetical protein